MNPHPRKAMRSGSAIDNRVQSYRRARRSPLDDEPLRAQELAHAVAQIPLQLDALVGGRAAGPARALQLLREILQEGGVVREAEDDGDGLAPSPGPLHAQLRDGPLGNRLGGRPAAPAPPLGLSAAPANSSRRAGT